MKKLGFVYIISRRKRLIVKTNFIPKLGIEVYDKNKNKVGIVIDVLGPVKQPFIAVKPYNKDNIEQYLNQELFVINHK